MKTFSADAISALRAGQVITSGAAYIGGTNPVRLWGGHGDIDLAGQAFTGIGDRGLVEASGGALGGTAGGVQLTLSGVDPDVMAQVDVRALRGAPVVLWRLIFNGSGSTLLHAAVFLRGRVDKATIEETPGAGSAIIVGVEGAARGLGRRSERMRSDADQRLISATDGALKRVAYAAQKPIYWGGRPPERTSSAFVSGSAAGGVGGLGGYSDAA